MTGTMQTSNIATPLAPDMCGVERDNGEELVSLTPTGGLRLNLGCGKARIEGWVNIDRDDGTEAYPLPQYADGTVDEIRASHLLEHFSYRDTINVLREWHRVLKPGGRIRIAVPDFKRIVDKWEKGSDPDIEAYLMGGHMDRNDVHLAMFTDGKLAELLTVCGFVKQFRWKSELTDCAGMDVSINIGGVKVDPKSMDMTSTTAICSMPRLSFTGHAFAVAQTLRNTGCKLIKCGGAWWHHGMTTLIEKAVADGAEYILALDYDTVFAPDDAVILHDIMRRNPDIDALAPLQMRRGGDSPIVGFIGTAGKWGELVNLDRDIFNAESLKVRTAHFGLTMLRASSLKRLSKPWFWEQPNKDGGWTDGKIDADIWFWRQFEKCGLNLHLANRIAVGHIEEMVTWPDVNMQPIRDYLGDFERSGAPAGVWR